MFETLQFPATLVLIPLTQIPREFPADGADFKGRNFNLKIFNFNFVYSQLTTHYLQQFSSYELQDNMEHPAFFEAQSGRFSKNSSCFLE